MLEFERQAWEMGCKRIAGVDEAGRGPLAGPVVAAALVFDARFLLENVDGMLSRLDDSKKLSERTREDLFELLVTNPHVEIGIGSATPAEIDRINILNATHAAMRRALLCLSPLPDRALVDGLPVPGLPCPSTAIVRGDSRSITIAAASIVAKVTRDRIMVDIGRTYSQYGFARHKGYGTKAHAGALLEHGPSPVHRRSFQPVRDAEQIRLRGMRREETGDR